MAISEFTKLALKFEKKNKKISQFTQFAIDNFRFERAEQPMQPVQPARFSTVKKVEIPTTFQQGFMENGKFVVRDITPRGGEIREASRKTGFFEGTKRFAARTYYGLLSSVAKSADFFSNLAIRHLLEGEAETRIKGIKPVRPKIVIEKQKAWKDFYNKKLEEGELPLTQFREFTSKLRNQQWLQPSKGYQEASLKEKMTTRLGETVFLLGPDIISSMAPFAINPLLGYSLIVGSVASDVSEDAMSYGVPRYDAELLAVITALFIGILDKVVPDRLFPTKGIKKKFIGGFAKRFYKTTFLEVSTEVDQEIIQIIAEKTFRDDLGWDEVATRVVMAGFGGALGGGGMQTIVSFTNNVQRKQILQIIKEQPIGLSIKDVSKEYLLVQEVRKFKTAEEFVEKSLDIIKKVKQKIPLTKSEELIKNGLLRKGELLDVNNIINQANRIYNQAVETAVKAPKFQKGEIINLKNVITKYEIIEDPGVGQIKVMRIDGKGGINSVPRASIIKIEPTKALAVVGGEGFILPEAPTEARISAEVRATRELKSLQLEQKKKIEVQKIKEAIQKIEDTYDAKVAKIKDSKEILKRRREFIKAVKSQFGLSDSDLKSITRKDIRLMSNKEFKDFLDDIRDKSELLAERIQAKNELILQIQDKELDIEPLRQAMGFPSITNMTTSQLREMDTAIQPFMKDDVFLSKRKLETIDRTELAGIKTYREARERLAKKLNIPVKDLENIEVKEFDRFRGQSALAERDPFFRMMVEETSRLRFIREAEFLEIEGEANKLAKKIKTTLVQKLIPQQKNIRRWFEATDKSTVELTKPEADLVKFMQGEWIKALEYLIKHNALSKGFKSENYFTHIRRGILEATKEDGFIQAFKEVFDQYKLDEQNFDILDTRTGEVLALDKFFRFALKRADTLKPTENILRAFLIYMRTFKKKQALDEIVPLIDIYAHALTPEGVTKEGLLLHGNLIKFTKEWLNTQKGRRITSWAKQGGKFDWALRFGIATTSMLDLAGNVAVGVATQAGEIAITYQLLGKVGIAKGYFRLATPKGRRIIRKYRNFTGKNPWKQLIEPMKSIGDRLNEGVFALFSDANVRRNEVFLLANLTKEEWANEALSPQKLAELKIAVGRYGVIEGAKSIIGATPEAAVLKQYKSWALPIIGSQIRNIKYTAKFLASGGKVEQVRAKRALFETARMFEMGIAVLVVGAMLIDEDDDTFIGKLKKRAYQEALTLYGAIGVATAIPRLFNLLKDLSDSLISIIKLERYKQSQFGKFEVGDLKGIRRLKRLFTPRVIKQFETDKKKELKDIKKEIFKDIESGKLSTEAAKEKFINELIKLERREKKERFALSIKEYKNNLADRIKNKEITVEDAKEELIEYFEKNVDSFESKDEGSFIDKVVLYAKAIRTDPVTAFITLFRNNEIRKIENGTIIIKRNVGIFGKPTGFSTDVRRERGATKELILDHILPIQLGGLDVRSNVKLVTVDEWKEYTPVENYLGNKLRTGLISKKEAQRLIIEFKDGKIKKEDIIK